MENIPELSIIVPVYNSEIYLEDCIESIIKQDNFKDYELILIDDCSTDHSYHILCKYAQQEKNIKVIKNESNKGQGATRNVGIRLAQGKYVGFVDSDDYICPFMYSTMLEGAKEYNNPDIITGGISFVDESKKKPTDFSFIKRSNGILLQGKEIDNQICSASISSCTSIYRNDNKDLFLEGTLWEDGAYTISKIIKAGSILKYDNPYYFYRKHQDTGVSAKGFTPHDNIFDVFTVNDKIEEVAKESGNFIKYEKPIRKKQTQFWLQRIHEILHWDISDEDKLKLTKKMYDLLVNKYEITLENHEEDMVMFDFSSYMYLKENMEPNKVKNKSTGKIKSKVKQL